MVVDAVMAIGNDDRLNLIGIKKYFADCDIFCAGRVAEEDLNRVAAAAGGTVQTSVNNIIDEVLGTCEVFEEKQVGGERFNIFSGCPSGRTATIVLRGGTDQLVEEAERSLHDAIMRRVVKNSTVVPGGGAIDMEITKYLSTVNGSLVVPFPYVLVVLSLLPLV
ncbi:PREDICTED: T-complex protein 1 subunit eta-like isoform X2 [Camelina sativa]|uniref:T-complex protein 1 subunit eta-like isoform X2 n=1 Tax=Camelina sativa TaxID=90675 RepID=A0ABM0W2W4_CAMSA|nr:PREDICTED: T-complex protein 1 subunit eta-like isoform X2 [Camelina sativa]